MSKPSITYDKNGDARAFVGREAVNVFAMAAIASALRFYAKTGMRVNRAYTPKAMIAAATRYTGQQFKARDYLGAAAALSARVESEKARIELLNTPQAPGTPVTHIRTGREGLVLRDNGATLMIDFGAVGNPFTNVNREELRLS